MKNCRKSRVEKCEIFTKPLYLYLYVQITRLEGVNGNMALGLHLLGSSGFDLPGVVNAFRLGPGRGEMGFCWKGLVRYGGQAPFAF